MGSPKKGPTRIPLEIRWDKDSQQPLCFSSHAQLLDHVTRNWRSNFVTLDLDTRIVLEKFAKRPFFLLISVDAPLLERYQRSKRFVPPFVCRISLSDVIARHGTVSLDTFIQEHDRIMYGMTSRLPETPDFGYDDSSLHALRDLVNIHIINSFSSVAALHRHLDALDIMNPERLRPSWDTYFMVIFLFAALALSC